MRAEDGEVDVDGGVVRCVYLGLGRGPAGIEAREPQRRMQRRPRPFCCRDVRVKMNCSEDWYGMLLVGGDGDTKVVCAVRAALSLCLTAQSYLIWECADASTQPAQLCVPLYTDDSAGSV